ncbi:MAG: class I SAM-dependent methyltransferase [Anaerolineae bacterium]|nr:class I SAM-dependent methyltransferase [Anaerolineae bacterium]
MSDHFKTIYASHAAQYDAMVSREDYQGNLLPALQQIRPLKDLHVVEMGAGTGRLTRLLAPVVASIAAYDASAHMLETARASLTALGLANWQVAEGDNRALPAPDASADLCIAGWSFGHFCGWYPDSWRAEIGTALAEMQRILKPGGTAIILETLGTGRETPAPPAEHLAAYYRWLEGEHGFASTWIRTDYRFQSVQEADDLTRFFFGDELADRIVREQLTILPECTGIWWRTY